jgi:uncharacterized protein
MGPMSSSETISRENRRTLLRRLARQSIQHGLERGGPLLVDPNEFPPELTVIRATFVTLEKAGALRGCIGSLTAVRPLVEDVAQNAYSAAFKDPRFPPVEVQEVDALEIHLSILSPPEPMQVASEADLIAQLRPGVDGLIIEDGGRQATFLPSVWRSLPQPELFLQHLKQKAGLAPDHWSERFKAYRYTTEMIEEADA